MTEYSNADKRGYLDQGFRLFHLKDTLAQKLQPHYHEFDKIILPLGGRVTYVVEGVAYFLKPWDMLLVQHNLIHRVAIDPEEPYERIVIWLGREWMHARSDPEEPLDQCFEIARERGFHLLRGGGEQRLSYMQSIQRLEEALRSFLEGCGIGGVAGMLYALYYGSLSASMGGMATMKAFSSSVLGGLVDIQASAIGGLLIGISENYGIALFSSSLRDMIAFVFLIIVLIFFPKGLRIKIGRKAK